MTSPCKQFFRDSFAVWPSYTVVADPTAGNGVSRHPADFILRGINLLHYPILVGSSRSF